MKRILFSVLIFSSILIAESASAATVAFYANAGTTPANEAGSAGDTPTYLRQNDTKNISIAYLLKPDWTITSATLSLKLADDQCVGGHGTPCPDSTSWWSNYDKQEVANLIKIEGAAPTVSVTGVNVESYGWYQFTISNLVSYLLSPHQSPLELKLKAYPGDFWYKNAKLNLNYELPTASPVPVPAAVWLFGSGLAGLLATQRNKKFVSA